MMDEITWWMWLAFGLVFIAFAVLAWFAIKEGEKEGEGVATFGS